MTLRFAYNTNGTASHRLDDALTLMAEAGYDGVALTLDHHHFDPFAPDWEARAAGRVPEPGRRRCGDPRLRGRVVLGRRAEAGRHPRRGRRLAARRAGAGL